MRLEVFFSQIPIQTVLFPLNYLDTYIENPLIIHVCVFLYSLFYFFDLYLIVQPLVFPKIILFIYFLAVSILCCCTVCSLSLAAASGGFSYGAGALGMGASVVVAYLLSCPLVCRLFLDQGLSLCPLRWQVDS